MNNLRDATRALEDQQREIRQGIEGPGQERQHKLGRLTARQRIDELLDAGGCEYELGLWAAWKMYPEWGNIPAAGVVTVIGRVHGRPVMVIANDGTVKAGAFFPQSVKKVLRAQRIAQSFRLPLIYLVDSSGVFLPLQDEIFPDEDDFGRIFRNNAVLSAMGIPQFAAVMGNCIAGGAYLPVLCDKLLMTEGSHMSLAGPSLVKAAIGENAEPESLSGASMHAQISGTVDFLEPDDHACLRRLRSLVELLDDKRTRLGSDGGSHQWKEPEYEIDEITKTFSTNGRGEYNMRDVLRAIVDAGSLQEYKAAYGPTLITTFAKIGGNPVGVIANQRKRSMTASHELQIGGVLYGDAAEKAARFILDCNQTGLPLVFLQDVQGFMVGTRAEQSGILRSGAKLVSAVSNSSVPKLTVILGGSFGAGNYALCGKAYDPWLVLAWPSARYAVMGAEQAAATLLDLKICDADRQQRPLSESDRQRLGEEIRSRYEQQSDIRYGAARGWVDAIIAPDQTRAWLAEALHLIPAVAQRPTIRTGVFQV